MRVITVPGNTLMHTRTRKSHKKDTEFLSTEHKKGPKCGLTKKA
jgi:hypothetical protein